MKAPNLNAVRVVDDQSGRALRDHSARSASGTQVLFRNLEEQLILLIQSAELVVGCVAWLTSHAILDALAKVPRGVMIVVQKEDFLRPDLDAGSDWKRELRLRYDALQQPYARFQWPGLVGSLSFQTEHTLQPVRCVGNYNRDKKPAHPRMHHKFLVFCGCKEGDDPLYADPIGVEPREVWTGSFNLTWTAANSLENAVVLRDRELVKAYYREWEQIVALSEPLDWAADWCAPEWRIGT